mmetsp:Transcript_16270/g.45110  ORF Transcript_16270/g.45110 Transcript_16270/m.45110 type:complete len:186 (+) Transcript_16270:172-729(+)|eukprot:CAMPEP_0198130460 /NCGR_PEP_ID=MMETSP1442-20131203/54056_1 /TAXON_ID= /ORGANISM="Craspedostauros australis, Strain CCMP3328" /LENGTH=185 /DNA_ID=CAMNT_0043791087 /DNA_START=157 /DNA_END=714 /DNA_ORIENTATION=+
MMHDDHSCCESEQSFTSLTMSSLSLSSSPSLPQSPMSSSTRSTEQQPSMHARRRSRRRQACVFQDARSWRVNWDGRSHDVTACWEGILGGKLVVLIDGQFHCICMRPEHHGIETESFGRCMVDGHSLELLPRSNDWFHHPSSMELKVDGIESLGEESHNPSDVAEARSWIDTLVHEHSVPVAIGQ